MASRIDDDGGDSDVCGDCCGGGGGGGGGCGVVHFAHGSGIVVFAGQLFSTFVMLSLH